MNRLPRWSSFPKLLLIVVVLIASAGCGPTESAVPPFAEGATKMAPVATKEPSEQPGCVPGSPDDPKQVIEIPWSRDVCEAYGGDPAPHEQPWYVPNHIIAIGTLPDLNATIIDIQNALHVNLQPLLGDPVPLLYVDQALAKGCPSLEKLFAPGLVDLKMQIYRICGESSEHFFSDDPPVFGNPSLPVPIDVAVYLTFQYYRGLYDRQAVADLVYVTGTGEPWAMEGSPWTPMGSPWTAMGSGVGDSASASAAFQDQWALGTASGIGLIEDSQRTTALCGTDVRVGVFDTAPIMHDQTLVLEQMSPPATLRAIYSEPNPPRLFEGFASTSAADHGLAVAGLIHGVAPSSRIYLHRVLDDAARGDLATLNMAVYSFAQGTVDDVSEKHSLAGAVINFSLGIHPPQDRNMRDLPDPGMSDYGLTGELLTAMEDAVPDGVITLKILLDAADCHGIAIVAASGNEASSSLDPPHPRAEIPATFASCLDVGASNPDKTLSCFSNAGRLAAPGGDGSGLFCRPDWTTCTDECGLIVPVRISDRNKAGYVYWAGTSFATPLVSGVAALVIESEAPDTDPPTWAFPGPASSAIFGALSEARMDAGVVAKTDLDEIFLIDAEASLP